MTFRFEGKQHTFAWLHESILGSGNTGLICWCKGKQHTCAWLRASDTWVRKHWIDFLV